MKDQRITDKNIIIGLILVLLTSLTAYLVIRHHITEYYKYGYIAHLFLPIIGASSFFVGGIIALMFHWGIEDIKFKSIIKLLPENERRVMQLMYDKKSLNQDEIGALCEMSRVKTSRAISALQARGILKKQKVGNSNIIVSDIHKTTPSWMFTKLPGLSEKRIIIGFVLIFLLGVFISVLNSIHVIELEHPLRPSNYIFSAESLAIGGLIVMLLRSKISNIQITKTLSILTEDHRNVLELLISRKTITQMDIVNETGINKMKVSRIIWKFKQAELVDKRQYGNTNLIISRV